MARSSTSLRNSHASSGSALSSTGLIASLPAQVLGWPSAPACEDDDLLAWCWEQGKIFEVLLAVVFEVFERWRLVFVSVEDRVPASFHTLDNARDVRGEGLGGWVGDSAGFALKSIRMTLYSLALCGSFL